MWCLTGKGNELMNTLLNSKIECLVSSIPVELRLGETDILDLSKKLGNTHCILYFNNFLKSPTLIEKVNILCDMLSDSGIYYLRSVRSYRKNKAIMKKTKIWKKVTSIFNVSMTWLLWYGLIIVECQWFVNVLRNVINYEKVRLG